MKSACSCFALVAAIFASAGASPIEKVVKMLQEMLDKSKENAEKDQELYDKFKEYCDTNTEEKTMSIADLTKEIALLENKIAGLKGSTGDLSAECAELKSAMDENEATREAAENIRQKEKEAFEKEKEDLEGAIGTLKEAIKVLAEVGADQTMAESADHKQFMAGYEDKSLLLELKDKVHTALLAASAFVTQKQRNKVESFLQVVKAPFTGTYSSQSGEIVGILKGMQLTFEQNLKSGAAAEEAAEEAHQKFMKVKKSAFDEMKAKYEEKQTTMGGNDDDLSGKKEQLAAAKETLASDEDFLSKLIPMCKEKARQFESRKQMRANEAAAISQALKILESDVASSTFKKTKATSGGAAAATLLQVGSSRRHVAAAPAERARALLVEVSAKRKSLRLATVAMLIEKGNPFEIVFAKIDEIIKLIGEEGKADKQNLDWCDAEREKNDKDLKEFTQNIETLVSEMDDIDVAINDPASGLLVQIKDSEKQHTENEESQAKETDMRGEENGRYQQNIRDLQEAQDLLANAAAVLKDFYKHLEKEAEEEDEEAVLLQRRREDPAPPETWADEDSGAGGFKGQSEKGQDVIALIEEIKDEVNKEEMEAHEAEKEAQHGYEDSMKTIKEEQEELEKTLADLKAELTEKKAELKEKQADHEKNVDSKEAVEAYLEKIKPGCDFISENYDTREKNREAEIKALEGAIELLKQSPGYTRAAASAEEKSWGACKEVCAGQKEHAECKACLAGVSVPGYCAGHAGTEGC